MKNKYLKFEYIYWGIFFLIITWSLQFNLINPDETYTLRLIQYPFPELIKLDTMDVHPPLYYIILKILFNITWINHCSPFIQVIAARIFSLLTFFITIYFLNNLLKKILNKKISAKLLLLSLLFPMVLDYATNIRMYGLAALFITCELFYIYKYNEENKIINIVFLTLFAILAAWTHYFSAVIAGFLLLYNFFNAFLQHNKKNIFSYFTSGIIFFISFLPWAFISLKQIKSVNNSYWIKNSIFNYIGIFSYQRMSELIGSKIANISTILFMICFLIIVFKMIKKNSSVLFKKYYWMVFSTLISTILFGFVISLIVRPIFIARYAYPIFIVFVVFNIPLIIQFLNNHSYKFLKFMFLILCGIGISSNIILGVYNIPKDYQIIKKVNQIKQKPTLINNVIKEPFNQQLMYSYYLPNKLIKTPLSNVHSTVQSPKLFKKIYPNIKFINNK